MGRKCERATEQREGDLSIAEVAETAEAAFGAGSLGIGGACSESATDEARSAFVRASLYLVVKQRVEGNCGKTDGFTFRQEVKRDARRELAEFLAVDENEVFRLHHRAAGLRARDEGYRKKLREIERGLARKHGMET